MVSISALIRQENPEISFHAFTGYSNPKTLRIQGVINNNSVQILIDSGSTHNFIQLKFIHILTQPVRASSIFQVLVGNGEVLQCTGLCKEVPIEIQGCLGRQLSPNFLGRRTGD